MPPDYTLRAPTEADIPAILALIYAHDMASMEQPDIYTEDSILSDWEELDRSTDTWVLLAPDGMIAAYATVTAKLPTGRIFADGYVHPSHNARGLGSLIVALTEARAHELLATFPSDVCVRLVNNVVATSEVACRLLESHHYELTRAYFFMGIALDGSSPQPVWPDALTVRTCDGSPEDIYRAYETIEDGFRDHWAHDPQPFEDWQRLMVRDGFDPSLWFLVQQGDEIVAAALSRLPDEHSAWVHQLAVRRPWRRRGLGAALLYHIFHSFYPRGISHVALSVDAQSLTGANRLYERVGMHVTLRIGRYEKELQPGRDLQPA